MTGAELKTRREAIGLSVRWFASSLQVQQRTLRYWEASDGSVPADAEELIRSCDATVTEWGQAQVSNLLSSSDPVTMLIRYRDDNELWRFEPALKPLPASAHGMIIDKLSRELTEKGRTVRIVWMDSTAYLTWLQGKMESVTLRQSWAYAFLILPRGRYTGHQQAAMNCGG